MAFVLTPLPRLASDLVVDTELWPDDFGFDEGDAAELDAELVRLAPAQVMQIGSGATTAVLARYTRATGASTVVLEPVAPRRARTLELLSQQSLLSLVHIDDCGVPGASTDSDAPSVPAPDSLAPSLVVMDGKSFDPEGIRGMLALVAPFVAAGARLWVTRGSESGVTAHVTKWAGQHGFAVARSPRRYRALKVTAAPLAEASYDGSRVVLTVLTGGRPTLLEATLDSLADNAPLLLETAHVVAFHNGDDAQTARVLDRFAGVIDERLGGDRPTESIGDAVSRLAAVAAATTRPFWLHLEDDWHCHSWESGWLARAEAILDDEPDAHQVRLRHIGDRIQTDNFVTGELVTWQTAGDVRVSDNANWTFNPTLVRTAQAAAIHPVAGEANAIRKATAAGLTGVVQLLPGAFSHLGLEDSLRRRLNSPG